jgi:hypothetical protein
MSTLSLALPKYEEAINNLYDEVYFGFHMLDEILSLFPPLFLVHNGTTRQVSAPTILDTSPKPYKSKFSVGVDMFDQTDVNKFREHLYGLVTSLQHQQKIHTFEIIFQTSDAAGHTVDGKGRNFWDAHIETMQKASYVENGYKLYMNAETAKKIAETPPTEAQIEKMKDVLKAKRIEHFAKRRSRRLR